ncbi:unnamed protein product [Camellia sinensis]
MLRLFRTSHGHLFQTPKIKFKNPNFLIPISHLLGTLLLDSKQGFILNDAEEIPSTKPLEQRDEFARVNVQQFDQSNSMKKCKIQISHPWPEWVELMEQLCKNGYFEGIGNPYLKGELDVKDANRIRTACLNFARDRFDLMRYFSRKDIQLIVGSGCLVIDRKVINSGKRLRAHMGIDEGNVCSSCILRGKCDRAYVMARDGEDGRTVDVMRILLTYGLDPVTHVVENKPCLNNFVKESVRRLLKVMVDHSMKELNSDPPTATITKWDPSMQESSVHQVQGHISVSMKQGDWICSKCKFNNFAQKTKCLHCDGLFPERLRKLGEDQNHLALKKGDWICYKCKFLNFSKNTRCFQCNDKPPKRQLNHGEWECDSCNYINFRRNIVCIKCDHRRPRVSYSGGTYAQPQHWGYHHPQPFDGHERPRRDKRS